MIISEFRVLLHHERKEPQESGVLDGGGERALVFSGYASALAAHNFAVRIQKLLQDFNILVVYVFDIIG